MKKYNVAILGATGLVGKSMIEVILERKLPIDNLYALASTASADKILNFTKHNKEHQIIVKSLEDFDFVANKVDVVISALDNALSSIWLPKLSSMGIISIDNSSAFRYKDDVPLIIPQINGNSIIEYKNNNIIANPNCSTIELLLTLNPIYKLYDIKRVVVSTYQSVSGAGQNALNNFDKDFAFRCIPKIDVFMDDNATKEEWKMQVESKKILDNKLKIHANCARVPTLIGHCEYVNIEFNEPIDIQKIKEVWRGDKNLALSNMQEHYNQADCIDVDKVFISRLRLDDSVKSGISYWCLAHNIRIGASVNAVNIFEELIKII
jgi:aspartate-semialdehyde dehydrogenase